VVPQTPTKAEVLALIHAEVLLPGIVKTIPQNSNYLKISEEKDEKSRLQNSSIFAIINKYAAAMV